MLTSSHWFVALPLLSTLSLVAATCQDTCQSGSSGEWLSSIRLSNVGARTITFTWDADPEFDPDVYVVQFRERDTPFFTSSSELNDDLTYMLENLAPSTSYEGQVCRAMRRSQPDDCGNCLICFQTTEAQEPPSPPRVVLITANGPETLTVSWTIPEMVNGGIETYNVRCSVTLSSQDNRERTIPSSSGNLGTTFSFLTPDTMYDCAVTATNSFGTSPAAMAQGATPPRTKIPGDLLLVYSNEVRYAKLTEDTVLSRELANDNPVLLNTSTTLIGIDYHFHRDDIYMMTPTSLTRMRVQLSDQFDLSRISDPETVLMFSSAITNGAIAVDWVNNEMYWVERVQGQSGSTIRRALINDDGTVSDSNCVVQHVNYAVLHIIVDPVRGYFYWSNDNGIYRVELNSLRVSSGSQCPSEIPSNMTVVTTSLLQAFTIESDGRIYFAGHSNCFNPSTNQSLLSTDSNAQESFVDHIGVGSVNTMDSFSEIVFLPSATSGNTFLLGVDTSQAATCPTPVLPSASRTPELVQIIRMYRSVKQPLPVPPTPPTHVRISTTTTTALITWDAPLFIGNLYSSSAFSSWTYVLDYYDLATPSTPQNETTTLLTVTLVGLEPGTVYGLNISAVGPGGQQDIPQQLVFNTKASGSDSSLLLVATESGVFQSGLDGDQAVLVGGMLSSESNGVTYDTYSDEYYWAIQGGQGSIYTSNSTLARRLIDFRDNPFELKFDWIARRLFWVEDGDTSRGPKRIMFFNLEEQDEDPQVFAEVSNIQALALDSINGILFWTESNTIQMRTLSGLALPMCFEAPTTPSALTVDVDRRRLYWLSQVSNSEVLSINQLEYTSSMECVQSISTQEIPELTFSSSPTVLTYAADTLFIGSLSSNEVYSVAADLAAVGSDQTLAFGFIQSSTNIRDVFIITRLVQPLPDSLQPQSRQADVLTPTAAAPIPRLGGASTRFSIQIEWDAAPSLDVARDSPILYQLDYSLQINGEENAGPLVSVDTSLTSFNITKEQQPLTLATVNASVTVFSLWYRGTSSPFTTIQSLPDLPGRVSNLRSYTYQPTLNPTELTALVVWDEPDFVVSQYIVRMFDMNGMEMYSSDGLTAQSCRGGFPILYQPIGNETQYSILLRNCIDNVVSYPSPGIYEVEITPVNPSGQGNSSRVTVNINAPDYPQQIIGLVDGGIQSNGLGISFSVNSASNSPGHIAVDTIGRTVFWFHPSTRTICKQSLNGGEIDHFIFLPQDTELLALSFEWVAMELYYIVVEETSRRIMVYKVPPFNRNALSRVLPNLQDTVNPGAQVQMAVDPFRGYLYYLVVDSTSSLRVLDLRQESVSASSVLSGSLSRRQTSGSSLSEISLAPALTLEPTTGDLLVSDAASGNILQCSLNCSGSELICSSSCAVLVEYQQLLGGNTEIGLPATSVALNEERIYWTSTLSDRVFAVDRSNLLSLINVAGINASAVRTLSPGQQPITDDRSCLSPQQLSGDFGDRLQVGLVAVNITSTTFLMRWDVPRLEGCDDVVFSYPPLRYGVQVEIGMMPLPGYPVPTVNNFFLIEDLEPYTSYMVEIKGCNKYTTKRFFQDSLFGSGEDFMTSEGVPDRPRGLEFTEFGTSIVNLTWDEPENVRGPRTVYYVQLVENEVETNDTTIVLTEEDGIKPGARQTIQVIASNGVLNSSAALVEVIPWPLAPAPIRLDITNTSMNVSVQLTEPGVNYDPIKEIGLQMCSLPSGSMNCSGCTELVTREPQQVGDSTTSLQFYFTDLLAQTSYCLRSVGTYMVVEGVDMPEITPGDYTILTTLDGRPDAPFIELDEMNPEVLMWDAPNSRSESPIRLYIIVAMQTNAPSADEITIIISADSTSINLQEQTDLEVGVAFDIQVIARNDIGDSNRSNVVTFTRLSDSSPLSVPAIAGISVGSVLVILIVLVVVIIIMFLCCCCGRTGKRELKSLSYMYGPDHELSNLRHAYRHAQANNPHYTWSMEDYVCTDEDLEILNKFPRQNLKLETFIDRGEFGEVFQGTAIDILGEGTGPTPVAVKTLRKGTTLEEQRKFLSEASLMSHFNHPNILKNLGVCVDNDPVYIILELMPAGDLLKFLRDAKRDHGPTLLTLTEQIQVALDVAHGCRYLEQQHFIHRDIAARNCLVSSRGADRVVKIGDFGLAKDLYSSDYYQVEGQRKLPVRWMAPEALLQGKFTTESDIWSYGVLLWEIMTLGNQPYPGRINQEVLQYVTGGGRLDRPEKCPGRIYHLMQNCWKRYSSERPHFEQIVEVLTSFLDRIKRPDSVYYSDSDSDEGGDNLHRQSSGKTPTRTPSIRSGIINLARTGSMKLRNSFRRHGSVHRRDDHAVSQISVSSSENLIASEEGNAFRERGPF